jgi:hypothetical protein
MPVQRPVALMFIALLLGHANDNSAAMDDGSAVDASTTATAVEQTAAISHLESAQWRLARADSLPTKPVTEVWSPPGLAPKLLHYDMQLLLKLPALNSVHLHGLVDSFFLSDLLSLHGLRSLDLAGLRDTQSSKEALDDFAVYQISGLRQLRGLSLHGGDISNLGIASLAALTELRDLHFSLLPKVSDDGLAPLSALTHLESLSFFYTGTASSYRYFVANKNLKHFRSTSPPSDDELAGLLQAFPRLESLDINCNNLTDKGVAQITSLTELRSLTLSLLFDVTDPGFLRKLRSVPKLRELKIENSGTTTDTWVTEIAELHELESLSLSGAHHLTNEGVTLISNLKRLRTLNLKGVDGITARTVTQLRAALPDCDIKWP